MFGLPVWLVGLWIFVLGSIFGSFLDVFVSRFHTGKSINGRSHCLSCGHTLTWYELFPLFSYLLLRGHCKVCHSKIPSRLFIVELASGGLFLAAYFVSENLPTLLIALSLVILAIIITLYDVRHLVIPNVFVVILGVVAVAVLTYSLWPIKSILEFAPYLLSGLVAAFFYATLWYVSKGTWLGLGDAKLAFPLGLMLTMNEVFSFVVLSFWVGAIASIFLLSVQWSIKRGQTYLRIFDIPLTMKSEVPFAPFLLIAFAAVYFFHLDVLSLFSGTS